DARVMTPATRQNRLTMKKTGTRY
ncbi:uncharacterized protein METZ01_LOCUS103152, partial [marine metagenome]